MVMSREEIFANIQETLVDALGVDEEEVTERATLKGDLGAESIDFLDIVFRLERPSGSGRYRASGPGRRENDMASTGQTASHDLH